MSKGSLIWQLNKEAFQKLVSQCLTRTEILEKLGLSKGSYKTLRKRIIKENINIDHILENDKNRTKIAMNVATIPLHEILIKESTYKSIATLKNRLVKEGLLNSKCYECGIGNIWNSKNLCLQLDHINGVNNDHRLENLRLLCPNCHSQTDNYAGRNIDLARVKKNKYCLDCNKQINKQSIRCRLCGARHRAKLDQNTKIKWPSDKTLLKMVADSNFCQVGKLLNVSDNAVRKRLKRRGLIDA